MRKGIPKKYVILLLAMVCAIALSFIFYGKELLRVAADISIARWVCTLNQLNDSGEQGNSEKAEEIKCHCIVQSLRSFFAIRKSNRSPLSNNEIWWYKQLLSKEELEGIKDDLVPQ